MPTFCASCGTEKESIGRGCNACKPSVGYASYNPWTPPFRYERLGPSIFDNQGHKVLDLRGWGFLTGGGSLNLPEDEAAKIQDAIGEKITALMNEDVDH
jgi:hypothetical protein